MSDKIIDWPETHSLKINEMNLVYAQNKLSRLQLYVHTVPSRLLYNLLSFPLVFTLILKSGYSGRFFLVKFGCWLTLLNFLYLSTLIGLLYFI